MKNIFALIFIFSSYVFCQNYNMNINFKDATTITISVDEIKKVFFDDFTNINNSNSDFVIESFKIFQNYPNPFNPSTTIVYQIPVYSNVKVNVYDLSGQLVKELLNENQSAGEYKIIWDGTNLSNNRVASGVYIYSVRCKESLLSKQMILLK